MVAGFRNPLGASLQQSIMPGDRPDYMPHNLPQNGQAGQKHGFLAPGSKGQMIAGIIADALAGATGRAPIFGQMMQQQRQQEQEEVRWTRRHEQERNDSRADKQWEWEHKPPTDNAFEQSLLESGVTRGSPEWVQSQRQRVQNMLNPMTAVQTVDANGNPAITWVPRNGGMGGAPGASAEVPTVSDEAGYNALQPGAQYRSPDGHLRVKGGPQAAPAATFP